MVKQLGLRTAIVSSKELGTKCWAARRFVKGGSRCDRVMQCTYPEKKTCEAVGVEIAYLRDYYKNLIKELKTNAKKSIQQLENDLKK